MTSACRQHQNVAGIHCEFVPARATKNDSSLAARDPQYFMRGGMVVMEVINSVPPLRRPSIAHECLLESRSRVGTGNIESIVVNQNRQSIVIWHPAIARQLKRFKFFDSVLPKDGLRAMKVRRL